MNKLVIPKRLEEQLHNVPQAVLDIVAKVLETNSPHVRQQYLDRLEVIRDLSNAVLEAYK